MYYTCIRDQKKRLSTISYRMERFRCDKMIVDIFDRKVQNSNMKMYMAKRLIENVLIKINPLRKFSTNSLATETIL